MRILGISCHYHEAAAALIVDGRIVAAAAEERFTRKKHDSSFPTNAIDFCLSQGNIRADELDYIAFYEKPLVKFERNVTMGVGEFPLSRGFFVESMKRSFTRNLWVSSAIIDKLGIPRDRILFVPQHLCHAAASFYPSPFQRAAYLTLDAVGEWSTGSWGMARGNKLFPVAELRFPHSVGLLYSAFTAYLGFEVNDGEFKVMGMAAYGKPRYVALVKKLYHQFFDGSISLDMKYFTFHRSSTTMYSKAFEALFHGLDRFDIAASIQLCAQEIIVTMLSYIHKKTGEDAVVFGGGVALNSVVNGLATGKTPFKHLFIFPAAGDDGGAVGAALYVYHHVLGQKKRFPLRDVFLGKSYGDKEIEESLRSAHVRFRKMNDRLLISYISDALSKGNIVGWFEGRSEFGPRALGHRSILADPRKPEMKDIVNASIKFREEFRPFAPVVLAQYADRYFTISEKLLTPYMLGTFPAKAITKKRAPAVVHEDGTSRIQIVDPKIYPGKYARLLGAFHKKTGVPVILNTSFNLKGEPIVETPADAISTFMRSGLTMLVLENYVVTK